MMVTVIPQKMTFCMCQYTKIQSGIPLIKLLRHASTARPLRPSKAKANDQQEPKHFVDFRRSRISAGKGGNGMVSFSHVACVELGGPDGGNGGNGGHVIFKADINTKSLSQVPSLLMGEDGGKGHTRHCNGKNARHSYISVPLGTVFRNEQGEILTCLDKTGDYYIGAHGGQGGRGNAAFRASTLVAPVIAEEGAEGEKRVLHIEMRIMAHAGLVGFPNAGKSTLLRAISRARPTVSPLPFTTLNPHVGMVEYEDYEQVSVADIPGLVKGSHKNKGLGFSFLRHIMRCSCLLYVIDLAGENPWEQYEDLRYELEQYSEGLSQRPHAIIGNKIDLSKAKENVKVLESKSNLPVFAISAKHGTGIEEFLMHLRAMYDKNNEVMKATGKFSSN